MLKYALRRAGQAVLVVVGVCLTVFITTKLIPGSPVDALLGPGATEEQRSALVRSLGLDQPAPMQFFTWIQYIAVGDLGTSIALQRPVAELIVGAFGNTLILTLGASVVAFGGGAVLGTVAAVWPNTWFGRVCNGATIAAVSVPQISIALAFIVLLGIPGQFPTGGIHSTGRTDIGDLLWHLILPAFAAGIPAMGVTAQLVRTELASVLGSPLVETLRARGFGGPRVLVHALHNTVPAVLTVFGLQLAYLIGGVVLVEVIFAWPGSGKLIVDAIASRDVPVIQSGVLLSAVVLVAINLVVDIACRIIDRRVS